MGGRYRRELDAFIARRREELGTPPLMVRVALGDGKVYTVPKSYWDAINGRPSERRPPVPDAATE